MKAIAAIMLAIALTSCAKKPVRVKPPSFAKVEQRHDEATQHVATAATHIKSSRQSLDVARGSIGRAKQGIGYQREGIATITEELAKPEFTNAPPELRDAIDRIRNQVIALAQRTDEVSAANADAEKATESANLHAQRAEDANVAAAKAIVDSIMETAKAKTFSAELVTAANGNADIAEKAQKSADKRGNYIGIAVGIALAAAATHLMRVAPPYSFAAPVIAFPIGYFLARFLT